MLRALRLTGHGRAASQLQGWDGAGGGDPDWDNSLLLLAMTATTPEGANFLPGDVVRVRPTFSHSTVSRVKTLGRRRRLWHCVLLEGAVVRAKWWWARLVFVGSCSWRAPLPPGGICFVGNPRSGYPRSDDDSNYGAVFPLEGIVLEKVLFGRVAARAPRFY